MSSMANAAEQVAREYEEARRAAVVFDLEDRALLAATGPQRQKFLHGLLSNDLSSRTPGQGCRAAIMDAKGHLLAFLRAVVTEDRILLEIPAGRRDEIHRLLDHYKVAAPVRFAPATEVVLGLAGPRVPAVLGLSADLAPESHAMVTLAGAAVRVVRALDLPAGGHVLYAPSEAAEAVRAALGVQGLVKIGREALDALRIEDGRAWYGVDVTADNLLHETGLVPEYHSPTKGCYVGQEVIARLEARGANVNRRLRGFTLSEPRAAGTPLRADGKDVGALTTAAVSPRRGPIAMGYVHRAHLEPGAVLDADGARAVVTTLPMTEQ
jgi:tRNA-modifying protein YgfZ